MEKVYVNLGFHHILDPGGIDHILFVIALCAIFSIYEWRKVLVLVTAFTLGHSLTLALSSLDIVRISPGLVERVIPLTIMATALYNVYFALWCKKKNISIEYVMAAIFGLVHGLGFSNFFKALMAKDESIIWPLLSFNVGVELGQIIIVLTTLFMGWLLVDRLEWSKKWYILILSCMIFIKAGLIFIGLM